VGNIDVILGKQVHFPGRRWNPKPTVWACLEKMDTNSGGFDVV
jgi:hypothetical protein